MSDLVAQLVGALQDCLDDSHQVLAQMEQMYGMNYRQDRLEAQRKTIADAEAALSAAKDGGWVAVPQVPTQEMVDYVRWSEYGESSIRLSPVDDETVLAVWASMLEASRLPNPPKGEV